MRRVVKVLVFRSNVGDRGGIRIRSSLFRPTDFRIPTVSIIDVIEFSVESV